MPAWPAAPREWTRQGTAARSANAELGAEGLEQQAALLSFNDCFWVMAMILVAMVPLALLLRKPPAGTLAPQAH